MTLYWKSCPVCRRDIDWHKVRETAARVSFQGRAAYGVCVCGMEAVNAKDRNYRRRWRKWEKAEKEARRRANSAPVTRGISRKQGPN